MKIIVWAPESTPHITDTIVELQKLTSESITFIVWESITQLRKDQGWEVNQNHNLEIVKVDHGKFLKQGKEIIDNNTHAIHIFVGFWTVRAYLLIFLYALCKKIKVLVMNEPYSPICSGYNQDDNYLINYLKVKLRPIAYWIFAKIINHLSNDSPPAILAISTLAQNQFINAGIRSQNIFPFGYFINKADVLNHNELIEQQKLRLVYIGSLISRKGLKVLSETVKMLDTEGIIFSLDIYGSGKFDASKFDYSKSVNYLGILPYQKVQSTIAKYDFLILPSYHEGWGVVINEALLQGVPVIISDCVGAKCLISKTHAGIVFKSGDSKDLFKHLEKIAANYHYQMHFKARAEQVAEEITPIKAAKYLNEVIIFHFTHHQNGKRPYAIWCENE